MPIAFVPAPIPGGASCRAKLKTSLKEPSLLAAAVASRCARLLGHP